MEKLNLHKYPSKILSEPTIEVLESQLDLVTSYVPEMLRIMNDMKGVGLAANQAGLGMSFAIIDLTKDLWFDIRKDNPLLVLINPRIVSEKDPVRVHEGCLSLPGFGEIVTRPSTVVVEYRDSSWNLVQKELCGLMAQCAVHETNHLNGKLVLDEMSAVVNQMYVKKLKKNGLL